MTWMTKERILEELNVRKQFCIDKGIPFKVELSVLEIPTHLPLYKERLEGGILKDGYTITKNDDNTRWIITTDIYIMKPMFDVQTGNIVVLRTKVSPL